MGQYFRRLSLSLLSLWLSACSGNAIPLAPETPTPAVTPVLAGQVITAEHVVNLTELTKLSTEGAGPVTALMFTPDVQTLWVVYAREGALRQWGLSDGALLLTLNVYPVGLGGAAFDRTGTLLATGAGAEWEAHISDYDYWGWDVWDISRGQIAKQMDRYDPSVPLHRQLGILSDDILLSPDGRWVLEISVGADERVWQYKSFFTYGLATKQVGVIYHNAGREPEEDDFDVIAFDALGEFFAAADEAGKVAIYPFQPPEYPKVAQAIIEKPGKELGPRPLALAFDPRRRWLAGVRGTELVVWDLQSSKSKRQLEASVGESAGLTAGLAFDPSGNLLGVGTANGWQLWDVNEKQLIAEGTGVEVYAVTFSPDGRLFAWGDSSGAVHIWGVADQ